jgi:hypothetical protein
MTCKHNWHFISADTDTLKCQRCGIETGPKPYEERVKDIEELHTSMEVLGKIVLEKP